MDRDFHYYGTYLAAAVAGFKNEEARLIATSAQFIDDCTEAVTYESSFSGWTPYKFVINNASNVSKDFFPIVTSVYGMKSWVPSSDNDETRQIWMPFHFLPGNYPGQNSKRLEPRSTQNEQPINLDPEESIYLLCRPRSDTARSMINFAKDSYKRVQANALDTDKELGLLLAGSCMHVFADTYAHQDFSGTPSYKLNGTKNDISSNTGKFTNFGTWKGIKWEPDESTYRDINWPVDLVSGDPLNIYPPNTGVLGRNTTALGHGQMGHMPDVSTIALQYQPQWSNKVITRNNPQQYMNAFIDMVAALTSIKKGEDFNWFESDDAAEQFSKTIPKLASVIGVVQQLLCPDNKTAIDQKIYDLGLYVEGREWFLASEARWAKALADVCANKGFNAVPGYNEAKYSWPKQALELKSAGSIQLEDFTASRYFKWQVAAKLLFRHNYLKLRTCVNGLPRILRNTGMSKTMNPKWVLQDEYAKFWESPNADALQKNEEIVNAANTDQIDNALLSQYLESKKSASSLTPTWQLMQAKDMYLSFATRNSTSSNTTNYYPSVNANFSQARPIAVVAVAKQANLVYLRTLENRPGQYLFLDFPTQVIMHDIRYNTFRESINQQWRIKTYSASNNSGEETVSYESVKYPGWFLGHDGQKIEGVSKEFIWTVSPYSVVTS